MESSSHPFPSLLLLLLLLLPPLSSISSLLSLSLSHPFPPTFPSPSPSPQDLERCGIPLDAASNTALQTALHDLAQADKREGTRRFAFAIARLTKSKRPISDGFPFVLFFLFIEIRNFAHPGQKSSTIYFYFHFS